MRLGACVVALGVALVALDAALANEASSARFLVTVRATVAKRWSYATSTTSAGCTTKTKGSGTRTITLRADEAIVNGRWAGGKARARFMNPVRGISGAVTQSGEKTTRLSGSDCTTEGRHYDCSRKYRTFEHRTAQLVSVRAHRLGFRRMRGVVPDDFFDSCPGEPVAIRSVGGNIDLADVKFGERDLFAHTTAALTLRARADVTTTNLPASGRVVQRVRWTVVFRRLGG
jgi:hypothetical protein